MLVVFALQSTVQRRGCVSVAVWSAVNVAGTRLRDIAPNVGTAADTENWEKVHKDVINRCPSCIVSAARERYDRDSASCVTRRCGLFIGVRT